jgi:hypothetical protein
MMNSEFDMAVLEGTTLLKLLLHIVEYSLQRKTTDYNLLPLKQLNIVPPIKHLKNFLVDYKSNDDRNDAWGTEEFTTILEYN